MYKILPFFTFVAYLLCQSYQSQAQVSITSADLPSVGTTKNIRQQNLPDISVGSASSSAQAWNFSTLNGTAKTIEFVAASTTPAAADFSSSDMARIAPLPELLGIAIPDIGFDLGGLQGTAYYHTTTDGKILNDGINLNLDIAGFSLGEQNLQTDPADLYLAPMSYGQTVNNSGEFSQTITIDIDTLPFPVPLSFIITIDRNITADAFGTLQLPSTGQPYSVLRYNEVGSVNLFVGVVVFGVPLFTLADTSFALQNYRFMTPGQQYPLVSVTGNATGFGPPIASIEYISTGTVSVEDIAAQTQVAAYPNPANSDLHINLPQSVPPNTYRLQLYNALGQRVADADYTNADPQSVAHLPAGIYTYTINHTADATVLLSGKVMIQH